MPKKKDLYKVLDGADINEADLEEQVDEEGLEVGEIERQHFEEIDDEKEAI